MDMGIKAAELETVKLEGRGDTAIEIGEYTLSGEANIGRCFTDYLSFVKVENNWVIVDKIFHYDQR
jgi:hypothetical protein